VNTTYSKNEERLNIWTHAAGIPLSLIALFLMIQKSSGLDQMISSLLFGFSFILLYSASTLYHSSRQPEKRKKLRIFDHAAIYLLIAGTYSPICLVVLKGPIGNILFTAVWSVAAAGIFLKFFFTGRFKIVSTVLYVLMGWMAAFVYQPIAESLSLEAAQWLIGGGVSYTLGAVLYSINKIPYNHAIFHCFVLGGSVSHFVAIYSFVL